MPRRMPPRQAMMTFWIGLLVGGSWSFVSTESFTPTTPPVGSTSLSSWATTRPSNAEPASSMVTPSNALGPRTPPSMVTRHSLVQRAKRISTATSISTVTPSTIFPAWSSPQPSSEMIAIADAGLPVTMRAAANKVTLAFAANVDCNAIAGAVTAPKCTSMNKPSEHEATVITEMATTCNPIGASNSRSSGRKISAPAAPAMNDSENRLITSPMRKMYKCEIKFVQYGPTTMPMKRKPLICGSNPPENRGNSTPRARDELLATRNETKASR
mmetsp:Transcript_8086/g.20130  ORF Transcript_8086/g.20130 Transcript_8086/m.20130 type:complete len:271 (+) Transcript_8086:812-1624(+)